MTYIIFVHISAAQVLVSSWKLMIESSRRTGRVDMQTQLADFLKVELLLVGNGMLIFTNYKCCRSVGAGKFILCSVRVERESL